MGCVADKPSNTPQELPNSKTPSIPSLPFLEKDPIAKSEFFEAIKKKDIILFRKTLSNYNVRPTDIVGAVEQRKTVLHKLAEHNFSEAMELVLSIISNQKQPVIQKILNVKDSDGNTPALLCCLANSVDTLEVLTKSGCVDLEAKNAAKKTAIEIAMEMESPCINVLTNTQSGSAVTTKATLKSITGDSSQQLEEESKGQISDRDLDTLSGAGSRTSLSARRIGSMKDSKELKGLRDPLKPNLTLRLPQMLIDLELQDTNFIDTEFPHENCYLDGEETEEEFAKKYPDLKWKRPSEFMRSTFGSASIYDTFSLADVTKSPLVGCEVYSAFAVMAEFPQRLSRVLNTKKISKHGAYSVNFSVAGIPIEILLDDYFPCLGDSKPMYARPTGNELWFLLFEKAFAKLYGGYKQLEYVDISEALEMLTGMPVAKGLLKNSVEDKLWRKLIDYDKKNYILCAGESEDPQNLHKNRIFNIVNLFEVNGQRLLKIRNHFGHYKWEGQFSAGSSSWNKELAEKVGYSQSDKSCFYMELHDFVKNFETLTVCHYHDNWIRNQLNVTSRPNHFQFFELNISKETEAYISVHQKHPQFVDEESAYNISPVEIIMARDLDGINMENISKFSFPSFLIYISTYTPSIYE